MLLRANFRAFHYRFHFWFVKWLVKKFQPALKQFRPRKNNYEFFHGWFRRRIFTRFFLLSLTCENLFEKKLFWHFYATISYKPSKYSKKYFWCHIKVNYAFGSPNVSPSFSRSGNWYMKAMIRTLKKKKKISRE